MIIVVAGYAVLAAGFAAGTVTLTRWLTHVCTCAPADDPPTLPDHPKDTPP